MALRSMTAYGRAHLNESGVQLIVEMQSVNRKHLEIYTQLPPEFACFEIEIKKWIAAVVVRGQVTLRITAVFEGEAPIVLRPNLAQARQLKSAWEEIAKVLDLPLDDSLKMKLIAQSEGLITAENYASDDKVLYELLKKAVTEALEKLNGMKRTEGRTIEMDIHERLRKLSAWLKRIEELAPEASKRYAVKLRERLAELVPASLEGDERLLREIGIYAEKIDISEEVVRFKSHLKQFAELLEGALTDIGKTLDFLIQEMKREVNTIGSKSVELEIAQLVIDMKSETERIREQIQNVE